MTPLSDPSRNPYLESMRHVQARREGDTSSAEEAAEPGHGMHESPSRRPPRQRSRVHGDFIRVVRRTDDSVPGPSHGARDHVIAWENNRPWDPRRDDETKGADERSIVPSSSPSPRLRSPQRGRSLDGTLSRARSVSPALSSLSPARGMYTAYDVAASDSDELRGIASGSVNFEAEEEANKVIHHFRLREVEEDLARQ